MRNAFAQKMTELASSRNDICLLSGDIGNRMFDKFKDVAGNRFINCGIAEANMMSMAAGMGLCGLRPVVYTITPFTTTRCLEQIRVGVAYHQSPVVIVGTGSGLSYAELGATHHSLEDIAMLRSIPGLQICAPADSRELEAQLEEAIATGQPTYIRIGKKGEPDLYQPNIHTLGIGKANMLKEGKEILILGIGPIISEAIKAHQILHDEGISVAIASMGSIKPLDQKFLQERVRENYQHWLVLEEHYNCGGLGSSIIEWLNDHSAEFIKVKRLGIGDHFIHKLGNQKYVREQEGIDAVSIVNYIKKL